MPDPLAALAPVVEALEQLGVQYHVGGSLASSAYGTPRATADVDVVAALRADHVAAFVEQLRGSYYVDLDAAQEAIERRTSFNLIHLESMVKVDIFAPSERAFDRQELDRAHPQTLDLTGSSRPYFVKSPEDLVLRKLEWYRDGGQVAMHQWSDVLGVLKVQEGRLDRDYLARWGAELGLTSLLERALAEAQDG